MTRIRLTHLALGAYGVYLLVPLYWLLSMAFRSNAQIVGEFSLLPPTVTLDNFAEIFSNPVWYQGFGNSLSYVAINKVISLAVAIPAA